MAACSVDYRIDDDGDDGVYIRASAMIKLEWEADDWVKTSQHLGQNSFSLRTRT